ncbi:MAG: hypothetical protein JWM40_3036 [Frankiales bacterium]|nr:hypothetical protein [Frankiales bacterium]
MPSLRQLCAAFSASVLLVAGFTTAAAAIPGAPDVPVPGLDASATDTPSSSTSPTATASATASASPSPTSSVTASPKPTPVPRTAAMPWGGTVDSDGLYTRPRPKCLQFPDVAGDAYTNPVSSVAGDTDDDLDLTGVVYKTTSKALEVFATETKLDDFPSSLSGFAYDTHSFSTTFTLDRRAIALTAGETGPATATVNTVATTALHATALFDKLYSTVVFSVPLDDLAILVGHSVLGAPATDLTATSDAESSSGMPGFTADDAAPTKADQKTYLVGDNACFLPAPTLLTVDKTKVVYTDLATVTGTLADLNDNVLQGALVTLSVPGLPRQQARTDKDGAATFQFKDRLRAGTWAAVMSFAGDQLYSGTTGAAPYLVYVERTVVTVSSGSHMVGALLKDDDRTPLAKQQVTFLVAGKRHMVTTDSRGRAVLTGLRKGTTVTVSFDGIGSLYSASKKVTAKAG